MWTDARAGIGETSANSDTHVFIIDLKEAREPQTRNKVAIRRNFAPRFSGAVGPGDADARPLTPASAPSADALAAELFVRRSLEIVCQFAGVLFRFGENA